MPRLRVLVVGDAEIPSALAGADVVGHVPAAEVVPAVDELAPNVLVLESTLAALAPRMASSPAGVVVASATAGVFPLLDIALRLSLLSP